MNIKNLLHICTLLILCCACETEHYDNTEIITNDFDKYLVFGKIHNNLLEVAASVCNSEKSRAGDFAFLDADSTLFRRIHSEQLVAVERLSISDSEKLFLKASLNENIPFYQSDNVYNALQSNIDTKSLQEIIFDLRAKRIIDDWDQILVNMLIDYIKENHEDGDHAKLKKNIWLLKKIWLSKFSQKEEGAGAFSGYILGIACDSVDWWEENTQDTRAIPFWLGADAAGAIIGAAHNAAIQYLTNKNVNLTQVGFHALGGAVISSTGIVKHTAIWICKVFK